MGGAAPADLRSRPARVSDVPRRDAPRCLHHATIGDRPDPYAPPHAGDQRRPRRRTEFPVDAGTVGTGRHATTRRGPPGPPGPLSLTPTPRRRAGTFVVRVSPAGAPDPSPRRPGAHAKRRTDGHRGAAAGGGQAAAGPLALAGLATALYIRRLLDRPRLNFLFCIPEQFVEEIHDPQHLDPRTLRHKSRFPAEDTRDLSQSHR